MEAKQKRIRPCGSGGGIRCSIHGLTTIFVFYALVFFTAREKKMVVLDVEKGGKCDLSAGKWVYDDSNSSNYPSYKTQECSYMDDGMACEKFGRKDLNYQHWRWQPHDCDLPGFNAEAMLEMLRGKRLVFVGDSLNRNQWVSMVCLVDASIPLAQKSLNFELNGSLFTFKATEYNASIDFYWAPLLLESNCDGPYNHRIKERIVRVHAIEKHARHWTNADILVFNSYIWWTSHKMKIQWGSFESPGEVDGDYLEAQRIYEMALKTWSDWLETRVNRTKTRLFFVSFSPTHERAEEWGKPADQNCYNETEPISKEGYWGRGSDPKMMGIDPKMMQIVEKSVFELQKKGVEIQILNITQLSKYRKDAHSSIYKRHWSPPTKEQLGKPKTYADCMHWCLPGVPDVWNELLYAHLKKY
ncbi:protein trichome birefringence-like 34 [Rhododendron vialii]|uniref:protein trichome birefringence-like 34 n=1 Tax=Rhododendron vialii TaxID=182163 RepID=UPI00265DD6E7|nr:protein trichome birefringence-like 34 [Rhododendron vialii]